MSLQRDPLWHFETPCSSSSIAVIFHFLDMAASIGDYDMVACIGSELWRLRKLIICTFGGEHQETHRS
jgi:hypothetical protein